ncbi:hypothetical protein [Enterobacter sp. A4]|uniref:hypothetical protein n=1 Tax=Enterobacter TaxID=547 RepID=UPI003D2200EC
MNASDYLRIKFQSDHHLALTMQNAIGGILQSARGVASVIYSGIERASWYSSCFIPQYNNVCQELKAEEIRTLYSIESVFKHADVIAYMFYLYLKTICDDIDNGNPEGSARKLIQRIAEFGSHMNVAGATRYAFATAASVALSQSSLVSKVVVERLSGKLPQGVLVLQFYGIQQKCALAARQLKVINPDYYWILYQAKLEMLYYFCEPAISKLFEKMKLKAFSNLDDLADYIQSDLNV